MGPFHRVSHTSRLLSCADQPSEGPLVPQGGWDILPGQEATPFQGRPPGTLHVGVPAALFKVQIESGFPAVRCHRSACTRRGMKSLDVFPVRMQKVYFSLGLFGLVRVTFVSQVS